MITDPGFTVNLPFDQTPCSYDMTYEFTVTDKVTNEDVTLTSLVSNDVEDVTVADPIVADIGEYLIKLCGQVDDYKECVEFTLSVIPCQLASVTINPATDTMTYTIGEPSV